MIEETETTRDRPNLGPVPTPASGGGHAPSPNALAATVVLALTAVFAILFATAELEPGDLVRSGGHGPSRDVIVEDFGTATIDPNASGYDGQQTYAIARFFPDLEAAAHHLDTPRYRMLRILPPALASLASPGDATVLALLAINLTGIGLAVRAGARLLDLSGARTFVAIPAAAVLLVGVMVTTTEPIAWGLALTAIDLAIRSKHREAVAVFIAAAFCRETAAIAALLIGAGLLAGASRSRRAVAALYLLPAMAIGGWYLALSHMVGGRRPRTRTAPLDILELGTQDLVVPLLVAGCGLIGVVAWRHRPPIAAVSMGFTAWILVYDVAVLDWLAITRVNGPAVVLGVLGIGRLTVTRKRS